ncbi:MAG: hypothetical protein AVDCRST_MAG58-2749 [uncultured Rubrobacteraceae bacterium]|uniref:Uncharacterized protein n=1 Tax=uncultured Rubrobacteraceae bacterium TaxID=349277 RepID=A0A6J4RAX6_9ACTN|nr:MAG: hypothetical protein AVDCRST_MAG58-2749 [uncultured Rubrobacteraceae bacterium]
MATGEDGPNAAREFSDRLAASGRTFSGSTEVVRTDRNFRT